MRYYAASLLAGVMIAGCAKSDADKLASLRQEITKDSVEIARLNRRIDTLLNIPEYRAALERHDMPAAEAVKGMPPKDTAALHATRREAQTWLDKETIAKRDLERLLNTQRQ